MPILVKIEKLARHGDATLDGYDDGDWFVADAFSFGVEREIRESGEKGGTSDINLGVGELQDCTISKSTDSVSALLAQMSVDGSSGGSAQIDFVRLGEAKPAVYLRYKLDRCFVRGWSTSGDADNRPTEQVAFRCNKIAFAAAGGRQVFGWDNVTQKKWSDHRLEPLPSRG